MQGMLSCASPASMPPAHRSMHAHAQPWSELTLPSNTIKSEPPESMEESGFRTTQQTSGFCSDDFRNGSPSSSSKDSNEHSPQSVGSNGENFYDCTNLKAKTNMGVNFNYTRNEATFNLIIPSSFEFRSHETPMKQEPPSNFEATYSPSTLAPPAHVSTPLQRGDVTPPMSPTTPDKDNERRSFDGLHDSGFEGQAGQVVRNDSDDVRDGFSVDEDFENEPSFRVPALNSHGRVKTFKCKQCNFVTTIKADIWEHYKQHIKPEKMLKCYKCPFVTEYKHHLEYHMRNHAGSKPFKCDKCTYSCVNKSMLNSHLKSHSNVYQYRCKDCDYATKYCHSLKLHLRKYKHRPGTVLNMDGTINPLPIIDVYGTRRGPKQKTMSKSIEQEVSINVNNGPQMHTHPLFANHYPVGLPYLPQLLTPPFYLPPNNNYERRSPSEISTENRAVMSPLAPLLHQQLSTVDRVISTNCTSPANQSPVSRELITHSPPAPPNNDALDLTNTKTNDVSTPPPTEQPVQTTPTMSLKNRRKGRAYKLQPEALRLQHEDDDKVRDDDMVDPDSDASTNTQCVASPNMHKCQHCDIIFGDLTMHIIHMGFHGYKDPFMCNKCGERCADRIAFFIHLGRGAHI